ncbi:MAG: homocysteine biosynthesis protein [Bacteroidota bacterium]
MKTFEEINEKIRSGKAVVVTADEIKKLSETLKPSEIAKKVDVVTTGTFGPMCSSGAFVNFGHANPPIRMEKATLNDVPIFTGIAAVDAYIGATETKNPHDRYGGAHVIEDLIAGKKVHLKASGKGTDCYPRKEIDTWITKESVNELFMFNPRNAYQNYAVAVNTSSKKLHTYMGVLLPKLGNATYSTSGELSPLLNDPQLRTIGIGTRIFLGGTEGYVAWNGTQFNTSKPVNEFGIPTSNAATLAVIGDMKKMNTQFIKAAYYEKYGVSLFVGIGIPIPILDEDIAERVCIRNRQIETTVFDYSHPDHPKIGSANYEELQSGAIIINEKRIRTAPLSSISVAREITEQLKQRILSGTFLLNAPAELFPTNNSLQSLKEIKEEQI